MPGEVVASRPSGVFGTRHALTTFLPGMLDDASVGGASASRSASSGLEVLVISKLLGVRDVRDAVAVKVADGDRGDVARGVEPDEVEARFLRHAQQQVEILIAGRAEHEIRRAVAVEVAMRDEREVASAA